MSSEHLSSIEIQAYVRLKLDDDENERVIAHLSKCDSCLTLVDAVWQENTPSDLRLRTTKTEKRLIGSIHRSNLGGNLMKLGFGGFFRVIFGVVAPLLRSHSKRSTRTK